MKKRVLFRWLLSLLLVALMAAACGSTESESPPPRSTELPTQPPTMEAAPTPEARGACGDGICNGPETAQNCPQDCAPVAQPTEGAAPPPEASEAPPETGSSACLTPNPRRAVVSEELTEWRNWLSDGGFEAGATDVILEDLGSFQQATAERSPAAARSGSYGYAITAGPGEGITFSLRVNMEKGETTRFSFWARSPGGQVALQPTVWAFAAGQEPHELYSPPAPISVGPEWTEVSFPVENDRGLLYALLSLQVGPNTTLHIDDAQVEFPQFKMAEYEGSSRTVGGVPVPVEPLAPTHISFLIHMEDPPQIQTVEEYFQTKTAVFRELARMFHEHGGFLTIQPEEDWVKGAQQFAPDTLRQLVEDYDVIYSTHTHGPHCRDAEGRLRSLTDCNNAPVGEAWDQSVEDYTYPEVIEYVRALRDLINEASGTTVTDHNGNWEFAQASRFAEIPMLTWSAYKNHRDQRTYDVLINNPWRPTEASPDANTEAFLTHDPDTQIVYIPGWSQAITRHPERVPDRMPPLISQFIRFADPDRVNSFYVVMHIDHFYSRAGDPDYIVYDQDTGEFSYSAEFRQHIQYYDDMLTELIDPLAAEGYLQWTSLPEIGELYLEWERNCGLPAGQAPDETPTAPPAQGRCGDGACAGPENTQNCPQDCGGSPAPSPTTTQGTAALPSTGSPNYEPPINIFLVLHIDPGQTTDEVPTFQATPTIYERTHEEIDWLVEEAARHNLHFTSLYNGWYPKWALENDDLNQFQALLDAGHVIGTHAHRLTYDPETDLWTARVHELSSYGRPDYDHDLARQAWDDADRYVDAVLAELGVTGQNEIMASLAFKCSTQGDLLEEFGFRYSCGSRAEKGVSYFGHAVWNPWRPAASDQPGHELEEDLSSSYIVVDHLAQVGIMGGAHGMDLTVPQMKRRFLMLYLEWRSRERRGVEDRVWTFGFVYHPEDGDAHNEALTELLNWLDENFVGRTSSHGNLIARYATVTDVAQEYVAWEADHPGVSSFSYVQGDPYPYTYALIPDLLEGAAYEAAVDLGPGLNCHRLSRDGQPLYVLWSDGGERQVDLTGEVAGQVSTTDVTGQQSRQDASMLLVTEEPLFVQP